MTACTNTKHQLTQLLSKDVNLFPNDENSTRQFYDYIKTNEMEVFGKKLKPGNRKLIAKRDISINSKLMTFDYQAVYYFDELEICGKNIDYRVPRNIRRFESMLNPLISKFAVSLQEEDKRILRFIFRLYLVYLQDPEFQNKLNNLCTHQRQHRTSSEQLHAITNLKKIMVDVIKEINRAGSASTAIPLSRRSWKFIENLIAITIINCNRLHDHENLEIGIGLDPCFSLINHSCLPNSMIVYQQRSLWELTPTLPIGVGDSITVNYVETYLPRELRRKQLLATYYFHCTCSLCQMDYDPFFSLQCAKCRSQLRSPTLKTVLSHSSKQLKLTEPTCPYCNSQLDPELYQRNFKLRIFFLAFIILGKVDPDLSDQAYINFLQTQLGNLVARSPWDYTLKLFIEGIPEIEIPDNRIGLFKFLLEEVGEDQVFSLFSFPFNVIYFSLCDKFPSPDGEDQISFEQGLEWLKMEARKVFLIDIPSDLSKQLKASGIVYLRLIRIIGKVIQAFEELETKPNDEITQGCYQNVQFIRALCGCGFFFSKQSYKRGIPGRTEFIEDMVILFQCKSLKHGYLPATDKRQRLLFELQTFFDFAGINIEWRSNAVGVYNALGKLITIFYTFDLDDIL